MKKRLIALLLVLALLLPAGMALAATKYYRVNTTSLKVRFLPSESAEVLGSYRKDYALTVSSTKDGWSYVTFSNGFQGYVQSSYIKKCSSYSAWITGDDTPMRTGPDGSFTTTAKLAKGRKVTVLTHGSKYDYISAGDLGTGYVMNGFLSKKKVAASGKASESTAATGGGYDAWVFNAGYRTVNLRTAASTNAPVIARYPSGTKVQVISHGKTWDKVTVDGNTGYMMTSFLSTSEPAPTPTPNPGSADPGQGGSGYTAYVVNDNKGTVNVRKGNSTNYRVEFKVRYGDEVTVLQHGSSWDKIEFNGKKGYIQNKYLQTSKPSDIPAVTEAPVQPVTPAENFPYTGTIWADNGKDVNVRNKPYDWAGLKVGIVSLPVGTTVTVKNKTNGFYEIEYNGITGYVKSKFVK